MTGPGFPRRGSSGSSGRVRGGPRNLKSMRPPLVAIFFMTYFHRARGGPWPPRPPPGSATAGSIYPKACVGTYFIFLAIFPKTPKNKKKGANGRGWGWRFSESVNAKVLLISGESFQHRIQRPGCQETCNLCGRLWQPSFYDLFLQGWGNGPLGPLWTGNWANFKVRKSNSIEQHWKRRWRRDLFPHNMVSPPCHLSKCGTPIDFKVEV